MNTLQANNRSPRAIVLQLALLAIVFQGVVATTPTIPLNGDVAAVSAPAQLFGAIPLSQPKQ
jgi:hypothetical protein